MQFVHEVHDDYWTCGIAGKLGALWIAWTKVKNDPWRDQDGRIVLWFGMVRYNGENSNGRGLVIRRLKIACALPIKVR